MEATERLRDDAGLRGGAGIRGCRTAKQAGRSAFSEMVAIDVRYIDKLDGRIDSDFFDRKAAQWRDEQQKCLALILDHQGANQCYLDEGIRLLELAQKAGSLLRQPSGAEKRRR